MKKVDMAKMLMVAALVASAAMAEDAATLTRSQWLKKIGDSAANESVLRDTAAQLPASDRVEFAQRVLKAVSRMPVNPEEKTAAFVRSSIGCINGKLGDQKKNVIAEVFADVPISYLPNVTEELSKRFNQELNKLSDADYEKIATETIDVAAKRNAKTDEPSVRDTFVALAFLRGAKNPDQLRDKLISRLPDDHTRQVAAGLIPGVMKTGKYDEVLNAAGVDWAPLPIGVGTHYYGHANLDRLLADLNTNLGISQAAGSESNVDSDAKLSKPLSDVTLGGIDGSWDSPMVTHPIDVGIERVPRMISYPWEVLCPCGYQNQGTSIYLPLKDYTQRRRHNAGRGGISIQ